MRLPASVAGVVMACVACGGPGGSAPESAAPPAAEASSPYSEAQRLIGLGQADAALAALQTAPAGAESLFLQGAAWAKKAETAPLPTPPPAPSPVPRGYVPLPPPAFKPEELQAISFFEQAVALASSHARAHQALAEILAPHALRRIEATKARAAAPKARSKRGKPVETPPPAPAADGPDASPERVLSEYRAAIEADPLAVAPIEALIDFGARTDRTAEAEWALQELLKREREKPEPHIRYGDYLRGRGDFDGAIAQYRQALIWKSDDAATMAKIGEIYITQAEAHLGRQEWAAADQRLKDAQKWVKDKMSPTGLKLQAAQNQLRLIRR
jgi:tetratricopeptide (TPR) repeat protein